MLDKLLQENDFESMSAADLLTWAAGSLAAGRTVLSTSFQYSGAVMVHMAWECHLKLRVATVDTLRLHEETYSYMRQLERRYGIEVEVQRPEPAQIGEMVDRFGEYLFFDSKAKQEHCCRIRKVKPHDELLKTVDCWISGVRRDQSELRRESTPKATLISEYGTRRRILKLNPVADWTEERLQKYIADNQVPTHPLYAQGYRSIGCFICSTPTLPGEDARAGRWRWFSGDEQPSEDEIKECGLHVPTYNI